MYQVEQYTHIFTSYLEQHPLTRPPVRLYEPADYILSLGGKRLRPVFALMGAHLYGDPEKALNVAMAVEVFHNFTLLHDDIMDEAPLRRGKPTVHKKYNTHTAILTGDVMMIQSYQYLLDYQDPLMVKSLLDIFNKMAFEVCEGQQWDMDFETRADVTINEYIHMITYKTSVLIAASLQMGSLVSGASAQDQKHLYEFAKNFGIAFQLQDDILDTFGEEAKVGKTIGGDILQNKKTYLFLKALDLADDNQKERLKYLYFSKQADLSPEEKIREVTQIFKAVHVVEYARQVIEAYRDLALSHLSACSPDMEKKKVLSDLMHAYILRQS
jgi:geranylgeranyl diphosphate synthase type II